MPSLLSPTHGTQINFALLNRGSTYVPCNSVGLPGVYALYRLFTEMYTKIYPPLTFIVTHITTRHEPLPWLFPISAFNNHSDSALLCMTSARLHLFGTKHWHTIIFLQVYTHGRVPSTVVSK